MFYKISFQYLNPLYSDKPRLDAELIVCLPQYRLEDARRNLFVKDLVRHPYIRDAFRDNEEYKKSPESILNSYDCDVPVGVRDVRIVYRRTPDDYDSTRFEFVFNIMMDNLGEKYMPFRELEFVCRREYEVYYNAFLLDQLVLLPAIWGLKKYREGDYVRVYNSFNCELAQVHIDGNNVIATMIGTGSGTITVDINTYPFVKPILLNHSVLQLLRAESAMGEICGVRGAWYLLNLANQESSKILQVKLFWDGSHYYVICEDSQDIQKMKTRPVTTIDGLQHIIQEEYGYQYVIDDVLSLETYIKSLSKHYHILMVLTDLVSSLGVEADYSDVVKIASERYHIPEAVVGQYLDGNWCRGYFRADD